MSKRILVVGAGPYGLSLAAHLKEAGVPFRLIGDPMAGWRNHMPNGMLLKSQPKASNLASPIGYSLTQYLERHEINCHPESGYVPIEVFIQYAEAFRSIHGLSVENRRLIGLRGDPSGHGFSVRLDNGEVFQSDRVVLAIGLAAFSYIPPIPGLEALSPEFYSHSCEFGPFDRLTGKRVIVIGSGSSAVDLATFLSESNIDVRLVARAAGLNWGEPVTPRSIYQRIRRPESGIGTGWPFMPAVYTPWAVHWLPDHLRLRLAYTGGLGPLAGAPMRARFEGHVAALYDRQIVGIKHDVNVEVHTTSPMGNAVMSADHLVFATGYQIDFDKLQFLDTALRDRIAMIDRHPVPKAPRLSRQYETSVPGLHVIGPAAAPSFGPVSRFVRGTTHPSRHLAQYFGRDQARGTARDKKVRSACAPRGDCSRRWLECAQRGSQPRAKWRSDLCYSVKATEPSTMDTVRQTNHCQGDA